MNSVPVFDIPKLRSSFTNIYSMKENIIMSKPSIQHNINNNYNGPLFFTWGDVSDSFYKAIIDHKYVCSSNI